MKHRHILILCVLLVVGIAIVFSPARAEKPDTLPVPRFVSLKSDEANIRMGPGLRYQIRWVYHRKGLPLEITAEFEQWRKVRDIDGDEGWLHQSILSGERTALVNIKQGTVPLLSKANGAAPARAQLEYGVMVKLHSCEAEFCEAEAGDYKGWIARKHLWGIYPDEIFSE